jgi:sugar lactone lactonase YvrE
VSTAGAVLSKYKLAGGVTSITVADGDIWALVSQYGQLAKITTSGVITSVGDFPYNSENEITGGLDGNLYITEPDYYGGAPTDSENGSIQQWTPAGALTVFSALSDNAPTGIAEGPDGNMWFPNAAGNSIGRLQIYSNELSPCHPHRVHGARSHPFLGVHLDEGSSGRSTCFVQ